MNPQSNESSPSFNLPEIRQEKGGQPQVEQFKTPKNEKEANIATEHTPGQAVTPPPLPQDFTSSNPTPTTGQAAGQPVAGMPQIADDTDLIEREWVDKAKAIVAQTAHDPYLQNQEVTKMKADYLKKRYNKDIKLVED